MPQRKIVQRPSVLSQERVVESSNDDDSDASEDLLREVQESSNTLQPEKPKKPDPKLATASPVSGHNSGKTSIISNPRYDADSNVSSPTPSNAESELAGSHEKLRRSSNSSIVIKDRPETPSNGGSPSLDSSSASEDDSEGEAEESTTEDAGSNSDASETSSSNSSGVKRKPLSDIDDGSNQGHQKSLKAKAKCEFCEV